MLFKICHLVIIWRYLILLAYIQRVRKVTTQSLVVEYIPKILIIIIRKMFIKDYSAIKRAFLNTVFNLLYLKLCGMIKMFQATIHIGRIFIFPEKQIFTQYKYDSRVIL